MKRNINLYRQAGGGAGGPLNARTIVAAWAAVAVVLALTQLWLGQRHAQLARAHTSLVAAAAAAEDELNVLTAAEMAGPDPALEAELAAVLRELDLRETIVGLLDGGDAGDIGGFSSQLRSLARQHADGVWLTQVAVSAPGARTTLAGEALSPESVPLYLRRLSAEPALAGQRFDRFSIERPPDDEDTVRFALNRSDSPLTEVSKP